MKRWLVPFMVVLAPLAHADKTNVGFSSSTTTEVPSLKTDNLNPSVLKLALEAYNCAKLSGLSKSQTLTIIDYSLPAAQKRMWVVDLASKQVLFNSLVSHGQGSGDKVSANYFSNTGKTHASSIGLYLTGYVYQGHNGYSLKLHGLDKGYNDRAESRNIVVHGAPYVNEQIAQTGQLGRSWGCPAVPKNLAQPIINTIKNGTLVFAYYPDKGWLKKSVYLNCPANILASNQGADSSNSEV